MDFYPLFLDEASRRNIGAYRISYAQKIPTDYVPHFTQTCRYSAAKKPPTDCAYYTWDIDKLYIPPTAEEVTATIEWSE